MRGPTPRPQPRRASKTRPDLQEPATGDSRAGPVTEPPRPSDSREQVPGTTAPSPDPFAAARALADAGRLDEAVAAHGHAARDHTSADGFCLLGTIELARGRTDEAARAFRNALYLDPDHAGALSHMIVLCRQRGELARADALRRRLARVEREEKT